MKCKPQSLKVLMILQYSLIRRNREHIILLQFSNIDIPGKWRLPKIRNNNFLTVRQGLIARCDNLFIEFHFWRRD